MQFSELKDIDLRTVWPNEANDFTPWLAANLERLTQVIGIPLESEGTEVAVDQFAADILARNPADGSRVLIENQLEDTDHTHLGQILTYLAGLEAQTIIWIARGFHEAHLSAIRWLNEHTADPFAFFAVRVRIVQISGSPLVPLFEVLERPSGWDRQLRVSFQEMSGLTGIGQFRREFWEYYAQNYPNDGIPASYAGSNVWHRIEDKGLMVVQYLAQDSIGIYLRGRWGESTNQFFPRLKIYESALRDELGVELGELSQGFWGGSYQSFDSNDRANWLKMAEWLHNMLVAYRRILSQDVPADRVRAG